MAEQRRESGDGLDPRGPHGDDAANRPGKTPVPNPKGRPAGKKPGPKNPA